MKFIIDWLMDKKYAAPLAAVGAGVAALLVYVSFQFYALFGFVAALMGAGFDAAKLLAAYLRPKFRDSALTGTTMAARVLTVVMLIGMAFSFAATAGFLSDLDAGWQAKARAASAPYRNTQAELAKMEEILTQTAAAAAQADQATNRRAALREKLRAAESRVARYINPDGTYRKDAAGRVFRTAGRAALTERNQLKAELDALETTLREAGRNTFARQRIDELNERLAGMTTGAHEANESRPFFRLAAKWINGATGTQIDADHVAFAFFLLLAGFGELIAGVAMGMIHRAVMLAREERNEKGRVARVERLLEEQARSQAKQAGLLENAWKLVTRAKSPEYLLGYDDAKAGRKANNIFQTKTAREDYRNGYDDALREKMREPAPTPATLPGDALVTTAATAQPGKQRLIDPILPAGGQMIVHANEGVGKTWLVLEVVRIITQGGEAFGGRWRVKSPSSVLYVDGEMGAEDMRKRCQMMGIDLEASNFNLLCADQLPENYFPNICEEAGQQVIDHYIEKTGARTVVLDSALVLSHDRFPFPTERGKYQRWVGQLKTRGIAVILVNHDNNNGKQYGSRIQNIKAETRIHLTAKNTDAGDGPLIISFEKSRGFHGRDKAPIIAEFRDGKWRVTLSNPAKNVTQENQRVTKGLQGLHGGLQGVTSQNVTHITQENQKVTRGLQGLDVTHVTPEKGGVSGVTSEGVTIEEITELIDYPKDAPTQAEKIRDLASQMIRVGVKPTPTRVVKISERLNGQPLNKGQVSFILNNEFPEHDHRRAAGVK